jgi:hypothetical protein
MKVLAIALGLIASVTALKHQVTGNQLHNDEINHKAVNHEWASSSSTTSNKANLACQKNCGTKAGKICSFDTMVCCQKTGCNWAMSCKKEAIIKKVTGCK